MIMANAELFLRKRWKLRWLITINLGPRCALYSTTSRWTSCTGVRAQPFKKSRKTCKIYVFVIVGLLTSAISILALEGMDVAPPTWSSVVRGWRDEAILFSEYDVYLNSRQYFQALNCNLDEDEWTPCRNSSGVVRSIFCHSVCSGFLLNTSQS